MKAPDEVCARCLRPVMVVLVLLCAAPLWAAGAWRIVKVLDGDTMEMSGPWVTERVRLIGVNTPERSSPWPCEQRWAGMAKALTQGLVGMTVRVELDVEAVDRYGRTLAYVFIPQGEDEVMLNALLLQLGLAAVGESGKNRRYRSVFKGLEAEAKAAERGVWGE